MSKIIYISQYKELIFKLRVARRERNLTQLEVAQKLNKPQSYISKIELGERRVDITELALIAKIYDKPLTFFVS